MTTDRKKPEGNTYLTAEPHKLGPVAACQLLVLWVERKVAMDEDEFEDLCDVLYDHIERLRDDRYRLISLSEFRDGSEESGEG